MYTNAFLDCYHHLCEDAIRAIPVNAQREVCIDVSNKVTPSGASQKRKEAIRATRELVMSEFDKFANYIIDDRNHRGAVKQEMELKRVKNVKAETVDAIYMPKRSLMQLIDDVNEKIELAVDPIRNIHLKP